MVDASFGREAGRRFAKQAGGKAEAIKALIGRLVDKVAPKAIKQTSPFGGGAAVGPRQFNTKGITDAAKGAIGSVKKVPGKILDSIAPRDITRTGARSGTQTGRSLLPGIRLPLAAGTAAGATTYGLNKALPPGEIQPNIDPLGVNVSPANMSEEEWKQYNAAIQKLPPEEVSKMFNGASPSAGMPWYLESDQQGNAALSSGAKTLGLALALGLPIAGYGVNAMLGDSQPIRASQMLRRSNY